MVEGKSTAKNKKVIPFSLSKKTTLITIVVIFLFGLLYFKRDWLVVALINNRPIWRWQFNQTLEDQYGNQVLNQLINEQLIKQEAKKENIVVSQEKIDQEISQIENRLGPDSSLEEVLTLQNLSLEKLREEIKSQLILEELLSRGLEISKEEVDQYLKENEDLIISEDETERINEATEAIKMEKINEKFQSWYQELRDNSKIASFITLENLSL